MYNLVTLTTSPDVLYRLVGGMEGRLRDRWGLGSIWQYGHINDFGCLSWSEKSYTETYTGANLKYILFWGPINNLLIYKTNTRCPCGGIGRRGRLKICCPQGRGSSSLPGGTNHLLNDQIPMLRQKAASPEPPQPSSTWQVVFKLS